MKLSVFHPLNSSMSQVSEQQLNDAITKAVENSKLRKERSQWSIDGKISICLSLTICCYIFPAQGFLWSRTHVSIHVTFASLLSSEWYNDSVV